MDPLFSVKDKICIVTGGLGQLGNEYAKTLHERGAKVVVWDCGTPPKDYGYEYFQVDITKKDDINRALDQMEKIFGEAPDVLVNNAGLDTQPSAPPEVSGPFENFPEEVFREVVEVNLVGTFLCCQGVGARMVKSGKGGSIINIGSIYGMLSPVQDIYQKPFVKPVAYSAAKSGVYNLTRYLATYWAKENIRVNTVTLSGVWRETQSKEFQANYCNRIPIGRMAQADEFNGGIVFLASDASKYMTGANLVMDGGWTAW